MTFPSGYTINKEVPVQVKQDVESKLPNPYHELYPNAFVYRVLAFTINSTVIVDLKLHNEDKSTKSDVASDHSKVKGLAAMMNPGTA